MNFILRITLWFCFLVFYNLSTFFAQAIAINDLDSYSMIGFTKYANKEWDSSKYYFKKSNEAALTSDDELSFLLGIIELNGKRDTSQAEYYFLKSTESLTFRVDAYSYLASIELERSHISRAIKFALKGLKINENNIICKLILIRSWLKSGSIHEADNLVENIIKSGSCTSRILINMAEIYLNYNRPKKVEELYKFAIRMDSSCTYAYYGLARLFTNSDRNFAASEYYNKVLQLDSNFRLTAYRAYNLETLKFKKKFEFDSNYSEAFHKLGRLHVMTNTFTNAKLSFEWAVRVDSMNPNYLVSLGNLYLIMNQIEEAKKVLERAYKLDTAKIETIKEIATIDFIQGKIIEAESKFEMILKFNPDYLPGLIGMAYVNAYKKDYKKAFDYLELVSVDNNQINKQYDMQRLETKRCPSLVYSTFNISLAMLKSDPELINIHNCTKWDTLINKFKNKAK